MALETASYVANLVATNPDGGDARSTADDHLRLIKAALTRTFPKLDGAVSLSAAQIAYLNDVSASVQSQLNQLRDGSATVNHSLYANSASYAAFAGQVASASFAIVAGLANSASYAALAGHASSASFAVLAATANSASFATTAGRALSVSFATTAGFAQSASFATTAGTVGQANFALSASDAVRLAGALPSTGSSAGTIVQRNSNSDVFARYFNQGSTAGEIASVGHVSIMQAEDGYHRWVTPSRLGQYIEARNISGRTGTAKILASGSGPPSLSGSTNGDLFFYY